MEDLPGARVAFPPGENPEAYDGRIIECAWDKDLQAWTFMRERRDKALPNAEPVYQKVWASIQDDIKEEELLGEIDRVLKGPEYDADMGRPVRAPPPPQQQ